MQTKQQFRKFSSCVRKGGANKMLQIEEIEVVEHKQERSEMENPKNKFQYIRDAASELNMIHGKKSKKAKKQKRQERLEMENRKPNFQYLEESTS